LGIGYTNAPASIAPSGGSKPVVGTNPFSISAPDAAGEAVILIDQSASTIARSQVLKHAREGKDIPIGWALDEHGNPTADPAVGLKGSMAPSGGYKGVGIGLMVELMAAAMTGACLGINASPFSGSVGGPPKTGQFFIAIDPAATSGGLFAERLNDLVAAMHAQTGARVPGDGRAAKRQHALRHGVEVHAKTLTNIRALLR
jgi:(2R)-3-sulfolactate dehydrogenase (NADP+)